jgi:protein ECT2
MYNDANLPEDEAWAAMSKDLRQTKESRNVLAKENSYVPLELTFHRIMIETTYRQLKRKLAESESQREE